MVQKVSGYARQRMGPKLVNCCRPKQMDTKEVSKMIKTKSRLSKKEESQQKAKNWRIDAERNTRKEYKRLLNNFEMEGLMAQKKACGTWQRRKS